jgi:Protein of unknown function (DUF1553)/Protein of unknown function (DUF1549)
MRLTHHAAGLIAFGLVVMIGVSSSAPAGAADDKEKHWAFQPIGRPAVPRVSDPDWSRNPIDRFVLARMEAAGIKPAPAADRRTLVRRLYLDLIGLPPSPLDVRDFVDDTSPDAVARLADRLLASPHYGERWGRHWLDVVRFAETNGYERDGAKPHAWRYRDYVIDALNRDKPYSRFLTEQLAGDEIDGSDAAGQIATTFLRLGTWDDEPAEPKVDRYDQLDDVLGTAATAFLGITLRCARCHDHKFEPFSQTDYYRMLAVFEPLKRPQRDRAELDRPVGTEAELAVYKSSLARTEAEFAATWARIEALIKPEIDRLLAPDDSAKDGKAPRKRTSLPPLAVATFRLAAADRKAAHRIVVKQFATKLVSEAREIAPPEVAAALRHLEDRLAAIDAAHKELPHAYIWYEEGPKAAPVTHILKRGRPDQPGAVAEPGLPAVLVAKQPDGPRPTARSTGRRLWLARWLTGRENPLVARVIANRIWQFHFGRGLVASSNDLGVMGDAPTHPELLDWLASETMASGWRLKPIHRLIVLSQTYQRSSEIQAEAAKADPENAMLWRYGQRRLEAEVVRDSILAASGQLNTRMNGPGFYPTLPPAVLAGQSAPGQGWGKSDEREQSRRSVYIFAKRSLGVPEIELLDAPDTTSSCEQRIVSTTGPQALAFLNGAFVHEQARQFASRLIGEAGAQPKDQVERAFALALSRPPEPDEAQAALLFLQKQEQQIKSETADTKSPRGPGDARRKALEAFCLVVLNTNEFVYSN